MGKRIVFENEDGSIGIIIPSPQSELTIEQVAAKDVPSGTSYHIVEEEDILSDRSFRDAWVLNSDGEIEIDLDKAKASHLDEVTRAAAARSAELSVDFGLAYIRKDEEWEKRISEQVQNILKVELDAKQAKVDEPEELKSIWIEELGANPYV